MTLEDHLEAEVARLNAQRANEGGRVNQLVSRLLIAAEILARLEWRVALLRSYDLAIAIVPSAPTGRRWWPWRRAG